MAIGKTTEGNPLKEDAELKHLLTTLDDIDSQRDFRRWKKSFLERFEKYLDESAINGAEERYGDFSTSLGKTSLLVKKLYGMLQNGDIKPPDGETEEGGKCTVMARKCLNDLHHQIEEVIDHLTGMLPATQSEEIELGYSKYHLGAVLIRDGFVEYDRLVICDEILQHLRLQALQLVADRVLLDQMEYYHDRLQMFCDVMADLGLYDTMVKCRKLLYLDEDESDEDGEDGSEVSDEDPEGGYVPPIPLPAIAKENVPATSPQMELNVTHDSDVLLVMTQEPIPASKPEWNKPAPVLPPSTPKSTISQPNAAKKPSSPAGGLYSKKDDDSDSDAQSRSSESIESKQSEVTDTSYFNHQPVWEQKKGQNEKAYYHLNTYYHGNPADFLIARKLKNQKKVQDNDAINQKKPVESSENVEPPKRTEPTPSPKEEIKIEPPRSPRREAKPVMGSPVKEDPPKSPKKLKKDRKEKKDHKDKKEKDKKERTKENKDKKEHKKKSKSSKTDKKEESVKKAFQPLPKEYPPPKPSSSLLKDEKPHTSHRHKKTHEAEIPPSINLPVEEDEDDSEEEKKSSFLPSTIGGSKSKKKRGDRSDDVEDLGMESAHGTALMSLTRPPGIQRDSRKNENVPDGDGSTSTRRRRKRRGHKRGDGDSDDTSGPVEWDAVLGPTDHTGRPELHRGMSVVSLHPQENNDEDSVLPETSLLAPKKSLLEPPPGLEDDDGEHDGPSVIPLTPSQIKAQQKPTQSSPQPSLTTKTSPENEDDSNRTSPTVSSTVEDDNADKSPNCKNENAKPSKGQPKRSPFKKRTTQASKSAGIQSPNNAPMMEIGIPDESGEKVAPKPSEARSRNHPKHALSPTRDSDSSNLASRGPRTAGMKGEGASLDDEQATDAPMFEITIGAANADSNPSHLLPTKTEDGLKDFSRPRRNSPGLKDYSKKKDGEDNPPSRSKSGLKDYSKRVGNRSVNISNTPIASDNGMIKDKQTFMDDGKSVGSNDMVRKPKKELKISMKTKEPEISVPPTITETPRAPEKKGSKEKKSNKETRSVPLTEEEKVLMRKKCYMWYARMGQPDRENMKRRVAALPSHCNMYVEDVDLLPWICYGTVLSVKAMNELFMGDDAE